MVEVAVGVKQIFDRLVRHQTFRLGDDCAGVGFTIASFKHNDVVFEIYRDTRITAEDEINTVPQRTRYGGWRSCRSAPRRRGNIGRYVRFHVGYSEIEDRPVALLP